MKDACRLLRVASLSRLIIPTVVLNKHLGLDNTNHMNTTT